MSTPTQVKPSAECPVTVEPSPRSAALAHLYVALLAFAEEDYAGALEWTCAAHRRDPASRLLAEAKRYLERVIAEGKRDVYAGGDAFGAFVRGGSNPRLYRAVCAALRSVYGEHTGARLLDIGAGDGNALLAALDEHVAWVTVVEPSAPMLAATVEGLTRRGVRHEGKGVTLQELARDWDGVGWDLAQATFSLQCIADEERAPLLAWLRRVTRRALIVEFDVPRFDVTTIPEHVRYVTNRYERGLAEYADDGGVVAQGFLMPVMFGYFDRGRARTNHEQPIDAWVDDLEQAGFSRVEVRHLDDYWWAPAHLLDAR